MEIYQRSVKNASPKTFMSMGYHAPFVTIQVQDVREGVRDEAVYRDVFE